MPLAISISLGGSIPIYRQIVDQVRRAILSETLAPGDLLPSVRGLAEQLVINPNTVARAYGDLTRDGVIVAQQGKGFVVASRTAGGGLTRAERLRRLEPALQNLIHEAVLLDFSAEEIRAVVLKRFEQLLASQLHPRR